MIKIVKPKKIDKRSGMTKRANGIKALNVSSYVKDIDIQ